MCSLPNKSSKELLRLVKNPGFGKRSSSRKDRFLSGKDLGPDSKLWCSQDLSETASKQN